MKRPENYPTVVKKMALGDKKAIVCAGDSLTQGNLSANWVGEIKVRFPYYVVFNAGINADLSHTLLQRIQDVIDMNPQYVTVMIGTNDVNATMGSKQMARYIKLKKIPSAEAVTETTFKENLIAIVQKLTQSTTAKVALLSLPLITENLEHPANLKADVYSDIIKEVADAHKVGYIPVRETLKEYLHRHPTQSSNNFEQTDILITLAGFKHEVLGQKWNAIARTNGCQLLTDNLHLNETGGEIIAKLVTSWMNAQN